jgi:hypothetical protein
MEKIPKFHYNEGLLQEYKDRLGKIIDEVSDNNLSILHDKIREKSDNLLAKYGREVHKYSFYHALASSTMDADWEIIADDFPGDDSVAKFIDELAKSEALG